MGNDNYKQGSDFFMTFAGKNHKKYFGLSNKKSPKYPYSISLILSVLVPSYWEISWNLDRDFLEIRVQQKRLFFSVCRNILVSIHLEFSFSLVTHKYIFCLLLFPWMFDKRRCNSCGVITINCGSRLNGCNIKTQKSAGDLDILFRSKVHQPQVMSLLRYWASAFPSVR